MAGRRTGATVGHVINRFLPRSATFIATLLRHQRRHPPVVLAGETMHLDEFPFEPIVAIGAPVPPLTHRAALRLGVGLRRPAPGRYGPNLVTGARDHGCALLHAHFGPAGARSLHAAAELNVPVITTFYGFDLAFAVERPEWRRPYRRLFRHGEVFCCEGPVMAERLVAIGAPRERVEVVKIGLDLSLFPFEPRVRERPLIVIQTGRLVEKKGVDLSIRAFGKALPQLGQAELWIIGDGEERLALETLARDLGIDRHVRFLGMLSHVEYRDAMRRAHIGIQPSRTAANGDTEGGAPTVLLEMQAVGMPLVATTHADIPAVVSHPGDLAREDNVVEIATALVRLAELPEPDWLTRIDAGRALVEDQHDVAVTAARVEALYDEVLDASRR